MAGKGSRKKTTGRNRATEVMLRIAKKARRRLGRTPVYEERTPSIPVAMAEHCHRHRINVPTIIDNVMLHTVPRETVNGEMRFQDENGVAWVAEVPATIEYGQCFATVHAWLLREIVAQCPIGVKPGAKVSCIGIGGKELHVPIPEGVEAGQRFVIIDKRPAFRLRLVVPNGARVGDSLYFTGPEGQDCATCVPKGLSPGQQFEILVEWSATVPWTATVPESGSMGRFEFQGPLGVIFSTSVPSGMGTGDELALSIPLVVSARKRAGPLAKPLQLPAIRQAGTMIDRLPTFICLDIFAGAEDATSALCPASLCCKRMRRLIFSAIPQWVRKENAALQLATREWRIFLNDVGIDQNLTPRALGGGVDLVSLAPMTLGNIKLKGNLLHMMAASAAGSLLPPWEQEPPPGSGLTVRCCHMLACEDRMCAAPDPAWDAECGTFLRRLTKLMRQKLKDWDLRVLAGANYDKLLAYMFVAPLLEAPSEARAIVAAALRCHGRTCNDMEQLLTYLHQNSGAPGSWAIGDWALWAACELVSRRGPNAIQCPKMPLRAIRKRLQVLKRAECFARVHTGNGQ